MGFSPELQDPTTFQHDDAPVGHGEFNRYVGRVTLSVSDMLDQTTVQQAQEKDCNLRKIKMLALKMRKENLLQETTDEEQTHWQWL